MYCGSICYSNNVEYLSKPLAENFEELGKLLLKMIQGNLMCKLYEKMIKRENKKIERNKKMFSEKSKSMLTKNIIRINQ